MIPGRGVSAQAEGRAVLAGNIALLTEAGVQVLYHTQFLRPILNGTTLTAVEVASKAGVECIEGRIFIDGTGDGDVATRCGVPYEMGNEELHQMQPATMFFQICNVDAAKLDADIAANRDNFYRKDGVNYRSFHWYVSKAREAGDWTLNRVSLGLFRMPKDDEWCVNTTRILNVDGTDNVSLTYAEIEGDPLYDPNRHAMVMKLEWDGKGYPVFDVRNNLG